MSAKCCHLFEKDGETRDGGKVITATAFEYRTILFKDLIKESISHSCNVNTRKLYLIIDKASSCTKKPPGYPLARHIEQGFKLFK